MHWQLETPSVPKSYSKGEVVGTLITSQEPEKLVPLAFQQLGQLFCCVFPPCSFGNVGGSKGWALQQPVLFGRVEVLGFRWMHESWGGQVWGRLLMLCSQVAQSKGTECVG